MIKSAILEEQKAQLKKEELAARILNQSRNELYLKLRYLDLALGNLALAPGTVSPAGTDGGALYYFPDGLLSLYEQRGGRPAPGSICMEFFIACSVILLIGKGGMRDFGIWPATWLRKR
ncbi:MAG: hypothetical protein V8Q40_16965 [Anaerosacchariphilus sp.]